MYICNCGRVFKSKQCLGKHPQTCKEYIKEINKKISKYKKENDLYKCECGKEYVNYQSLNAHFSHCIIHRNGKPEINRFKGKEGWAKGLTKETDKRVNKSATTLKNNINSGKIIYVGHPCSQETKNKISLRQTINYTGGRCKWYNVINAQGKNVKVQGTWEREFSKVLNILDKDWIKPGKKYKGHTYIWIDENGQHRYTPDFWCPNLNKYFEIKGHWWGNDKKKMKLVLEQNNINIEIVEKNKYEEYLKIIKMPV